MVVDEQSPVGAGNPIHHQMSSNKNLLAAIGELRASAQAMRVAASAGKTNPTKKASKNQRKRAARRAAKAANGSSSSSMPSGVMGSAASAYSRVTRQSAPKMAMSGNGEVCVVAHREYVAEVPGATSWTTTSVPVNPGQSALFAWLSQVAQRFQSYRFRKLKFCYETESPTSQAGSTVLAIDYDAQEAAPSSKQQAMSYKSSVRSAPWQPCCLEADLLRDASDIPFRFVRAGSVPSGTDVRLYDVGNFFTGVQNSSGATGELYVEYVCELHTPQTGVSVGGKFVGSSGWAAATPLGTGAQTVSGNAPVSVSTDGTTITFNQAGAYLLAYKFVGTVIVAGGGALFGGTVTYTSKIGTVDSGQLTTIGYATLVAQVGQTALVTLTSATTVTASDMRVNLANSNAL